MNINILQKIVLDKDKLAELVKGTDSKDLKELLGVKDGQISHLRQGRRRPDADGLLRLMMLYNLTPEDLATVKAN